MLISTISVREDAHFTANLTPVTATSTTSVKYDNIGVGVGPTNISVPRFRLPKAYV
tara:strand:+ start:365 stop:532 length:168 start_codon:yes stop_codon:yes gene_type:complete